MINLKKTLTDNEILYVCDYINDIDRNSDISEFYLEYKLGIWSYDSVEECFNRIMLEWLEDNIMNGLTARERHIYSLLGINPVQVYVDQVNN